MSQIKEVTPKQSTIATVSEDLNFISKDFLSEVEKLELLASRTLDGLILCNSQKEILFINNSAKRLLGIDIEQALGIQSLDDLQVSFLTECLEEAKKNNLHEFNRVVDLRNDYSILIGIHLELLKNRDNVRVGWMYVLRDVTRNWQSDQMRSALTVASHEIKTPLNSMLGAIDLLFEKDLGSLNRKQLHCLGVVKDDIQRLNRLLEDILDLSRFDEGVQFLERRKQTSLIFLVNKVFDSFQSFAASKN
ncbi:MAG: histidine kinase dimerization/phospho-acceptor domain-containing protein, partial [bacterium]